MNVVHKVTGYDKATERLAFEFDVPASDIPEMRDIAHVEPSDLGVVGCYPLDANAARFVASRFNLPMAIDRCDWFFEPFAV